MRKNITSANSPKDNSSKDGWTGEVEIDVEVSVNIVVFELGLYLTALFTANINQPTFALKNYLQGSHSLTFKNSNFSGKFQTPKTIFRTLE